MTGALRLPAPAKVNLALRVLGRRPDGFHELETIFQAIDLQDELVIAPGTAPGVTLEVVAVTGRGLPVAAGDDNLVVRAARAVLARVRRETEIRFRLLKRIPAGGGLGGGSSDAAAALRLTNALLGDPLDETCLASLAVELGADVPFFLLGGTCYARGIGERLCRIERPPHFEFVLVLPSFGTSTVRVFELLGARLIAAAPRGSVDVIEPPTATEIAAMLVQGNDLERAAVQCTPALRSLREEIVAAGIADVRMSGSGSTLFVARSTAAEADRVLATLRERLAGRTDEDVAILRTASAPPVGAPQSCRWPGGRAPGDGRRG